jgi:hypothetical protein
VHCLVEGWHEDSHQIANGCLSPESKEIFMNGVQSFNSQGNYRGGSSVWICDSEGESFRSLSNVRYYHEIYDSECL